MNYVALGTFAHIQLSFVISCLSYPSLSVYTLKAPSQPSGKMPAPPQVIHVKRLKRKAEADVDEDGGVVDYLRP